MSSNDADSWPEYDGARDWKPDDEHQRKRSDDDRDSRGHVGESQARPYRNEEEGQVQERPRIRPDRDRGWDRGGRGRGETDIDDAEKVDDGSEEGEV